MSIPLAPHPKHTISEIHDHNESDSSSDLDEDSKYPIQPGQMRDSGKPLGAKSDSTKDAQPDQDSTKTLVIIAAPQGRTMSWEKLGLHN